MVNYTHGDLVEVDVLVIQIFRGKQSHGILEEHFIHKGTDGYPHMTLLVTRLICID